MGSTMPINSSMFKKGDTVLYKNQARVVITAIHRNAGELYYDIMFANGNERQTVGTHLSAVPTTSTAPPSTLDLPFDVVLTAVKNFATYYGRDAAQVRIRDVENSSAGIHGWARAFIPPAPAP